MLSHIIYFLFVINDPLISRPRKISNIDHDQGGFACANLCFRNYFVYIFNETRKEFF